MLDMLCCDVLYYAIYCFYCFYDYFPTGGWQMEVRLGEWVNGYSSSLIIV